MKEKALTKHTYTHLKPLKIKERVNTVKQQQPTHKLKHTGKSQVYTGVINRYHCRVLKRETTNERSRPVYVQKCASTPLS